ncbi:MAG: 4Fe-4S binding protein [Thermodesulfovibrionales bacterium]|nr:4Fe-4S dicluster domain-containing protein [Nitrospinota bacterium]MCG2710626.1 4Fe-4S binding protein [Thermodesulfovibrionales bacterium]
MNNLMNALEGGALTMPARENNNVLKKRRRIEQLIMGVIFLVILIGGWFNPLFGYFIPLCMVLGISIGLSMGRKWCDWYCPRGSFYDAMMAPVSPKKKIPPFFKGLPLRIGMLSFLMIMMTVQIIMRWPDPYKIGGFFVILLTVTTAVGVILSFIFQHRTWCYFCPIGSMANWVGKDKYPLQINSIKCVECKNCEEVCPMQIQPYSYKTDGTQAVKDGDCLKCNLCVAECPEEALNL